MSCPSGGVQVTSKPRIVISVYGGVVQDVFCSAAEAEVTIVDWEADGCVAMDKGYVVVPDKFGKGSPVIVSSCIAEPFRAISGTPIQLALEQAGVPYGATQVQRIPASAIRNDPVSVPPDDDGRCDCEHPGYFCSSVPGIIARVESGRLAQGASVERCDACERYPSDEAALEKLHAVGIAKTPRSSQPKPTFGVLPLHRSIQPTRTTECL